ncbi:MAG: hypothetical protein E7414_03655 [Ruminococcaceae bacterium]|nr:hypothetical protein [Oscillospiraceae bacterium]
MKKKKLWVIILLTTALLAALITIAFKYYIANERYNVAWDYEKENNIFSAIDTYAEVIDFKDSRERIEILSKYLFGDSYHIQYDLTARINEEENGTVTWLYASNPEQNLIGKQANSRILDVAYTSLHSKYQLDNVFFALLYGGQVIHTDFNNVPIEEKEFYGVKEKEFVESEWQGIQKVSNSTEHIVGLYADGTVVAAGLNDCGQCNVKEWRDIIDIAAGGYFTVGLKKDGTVIIATNETRKVVNLDFSYETINTWQEFKDVFTWRDVKKISASFNHVVGLRKDGTVVAAGQNRYGQLSVNEWTDVVDVFATETTTIGLRKDGYVYITER